MLFEQEAGTWNGSFLQKRVALASSLKPHHGANVQHLPISAPGFKALPERKS